MQRILGELKELGANLVAITPQLPEHNRASTDKNDLNFHLLTDPGNSYAAELGLRFSLPDDLRGVYDSFSIDLPKYNGDDSWTLPIPARFLADRSGVVQAADVDVDYTHRPEPSKILDDLRRLN